MTKFRDIQAAATARKGGFQGLKKKLPKSKSKRELVAIGDERYLSSMSLRIFSAGLKHSMARGKWPAFEEVFYGFQPSMICAMSDEDLEALMRDTRIIRHWGKIRYLRNNAIAICDIAEETGSMGHIFLRMGR